jgi:PhzF family phenazine biosynthesis protein
MQAVAREMNLSETAFLHPEKDGYNLRWFTPTTEVDLCGHATLASAHPLWTEDHLDAGEAAAFHTKSGALTCTRRDRSRSARVMAATGVPRSSSVESSAASRLQPETRRVSRAADIRP